MKIDDEDRRWRRSDMAKQRVDEGEKKKKREGKRKKEDRPEREKENKEKGKNIILIEVERES